MVKVVSKINRFRPVGHRKGKWKGGGGRLFGGGLGAFLVIETLTQFPTKFPLFNGGKKFKLNECLVPFKSAKYTLHQRCWKPFGAAQTTVTYFTSKIPG